MKTFTKKNPNPAKSAKAKKPKKPRGKPQAWIFRLVSSRGSDHVQCVILPAGTTPKLAREFSETWAYNIIRGSAIESCTVSYKRVRLAPRAQLLKQWDAVCKWYANAKLAKEEQAAKLNPHDWTHR